MKTLPILVALVGLSIQAADKPNIVLFLVDDMGWMDSTPYGSKYAEAEAKNDVKVVRYPR